MLASEVDFLLAAILCRVQVILPNIAEHRVCITATAGAMAAGSTTTTIIHDFQASRCSRLRPSAFIVEQAGNPLFLSLTQEGDVLIFTSKKQAFCLWAPFTLNGSKLLLLLNSSRRLSGAHITIA
jgi:hypothetical protein